MATPVCGRAARHDDQGASQLLTGRERALAAQHLLFGAPISSLPHPYASQKPSENTSVWLAATNRKNFHSMDYRPLKVSKHGQPKVTSENAFAGLLSLGPLAFYVVAWSENVVPLEPLRRFEDALLPFWPTEGPKTWPPRLRLDEDGLDDLANAVATWTTLDR
jgi:hypothetical protein